MWICGSANFGNEGSHSLGIRKGGNSALAKNASKGSFSLGRAKIAAEGRASCRPRLNSIARLDAARLEANLAANAAAKANNTSRANATNTDVNSGLPFSKAGCAIGGTISS